MKTCSLYLTCSANLCPLDPDKHLRNWFPGENICRAKAFQQEPFVRRQKKINKYRPEGLEDKPLKVDYLTETAPVKRTLSPEHQAKLLEHGKRHRFQKQDVSGNAS
jgi:hypothetical protein